MALVHEKLYQSGDFSCIDIGLYIKEISLKLLCIYAPGGHISIETSADNVLLTIEKAISLGLILNELITNSLKHAFPDKTEGKGQGAENISHMAEGNKVITVTLKENQSSQPPALNTEHGVIVKQVTLTVSDNGIGFPEDIQIDSVETLGLKLVSLLTGQIDGTVIINRNSGTGFVLQFDV